MRQDSNSRDVVASSPFPVQPPERPGELARRLLQKLVSDEFCENGDLTKNYLTGLTKILITYPKGPRI